ncbi:MAG: hypothetical protein DRJ09_01960 [Bacteroidetes bacterium]|nr:MAG: hypothetical protein DRJ09_01960 [Bacteroidota bacterium]
MKSKLLVFVLLSLLVAIVSCKKENNDKTKPWIELKGFNPAYTELNKPYEDAGAMVKDINAVGDTVDISGNLVVTDNINTQVIGKYEVQYNANDDTGNSADEVTRTVYVQIFK